MPNKRLQELGVLITTKTAEVKALFDKGDQNGGVDSKEDIKTIMDTNKEIEALTVEAAELKAIEDVRTATDNRIKTINTPVNSVPFSGVRGGDGAAASDEVKSITDMLFANDAFKAWHGELTKTGHVSERATVKSPVVELKSLITGVSLTSAGAMVFTDRKPIVDSFYMRPLTVRDLITVGETNSDTVEYVRVTSVTNNAATVPESTAVDDGSGVKPESAMALARVTENVKTVAHWIPVTKRALADAGQIRTMIEGFLRYGLDEKLENLIVNGTGAGEDFTGIRNTSGIITQAWDTNILTTTRKARTKVRLQGRTIPTAYLLHPEDWEALDLLQDNEGRYYYGGPMRSGQPTLWGLPVVESEALTAGTGICANWKMAVLWDRLQTLISMTDSHADFFIQNLVAILAELRAAFGVIRPKAFCDMDLTA